MNLTKTHLKSIIVVCLILLISSRLVAQTKAKEQPFYSYFLWYNGTISGYPVKAKIAVSNGEYTISYAYTYNKKWIPLTDLKIRGKTLSAKAIMDNYNYTVTLSIDNLWDIKGLLITEKGKKLPIKLKSTLKDPQVAKEKTAFKNELTPMLLQPKIKADTIQVYYSEELENGRRSAVEMQTYTKIYPNKDNKITYVDINFDGYLDLAISNSIYIFNTKKQRFEVENYNADFYPGIEYIGAYNIFNNTFQASYSRDIIWYKPINGVITPYETESYTEYDSNVKHHVGVSENRIRDIGKEAKYSILDLSINDESIVEANEIVKQFIGDSQMEIMDNAQLILRYSSGKNHFYEYEDAIWKLLYTKFEGKKTYPKPKNEYFANGKPKAIGAYDDQGYRTGEWKDYYKNGQLEEVGNWDFTDTGRIYVGVRKEYYENGQLKDSTNFTKKGNPIGKSTSYYQNGQLKEIAYWADKGRTGEHKTFFEFGEVHETGNYINDKKSGEWKTYFENGQLESIGNYNNGEKIGERKGYFENGKLSYIGYFIDGKHTGEWKHYDKYGRLKNIKNYLNSERSGEWKTYYDNNDDKELFSVGNYLLGEKIGTWKYYRQGGKLKSISIYNNDLLFNTSYFKNGNIRYVKEYKKEKLKKWKEYFENGQLSFSGKYSKGKEDGKQKGYYLNGKLQLISHYSKGIRKRVYKLYHSNGQLHEKGKYINGKQEGKWKHYTENGKLTKIEFWEDGKLISTEEK